MVQSLFQVENKSGKAHIKIIGSIGGWRNNSQEFTQKVDALIAAGVEDSDLYINSYGGIMTEANEIINQLLRFTGTRTITIGAIAASAAFTIVAEFTKELTYCHSNTVCMYHDPAGTYRIERMSDFDSNKEAYGKLRKQVVKSLAARMGMTKQEVSTKMTKTTWLDSDDLVKVGIVAKNNIINKKEKAPEGARNGLENMGFNIPSFFNALEEPLPEIPQLPTNQKSDNHMESKEFAKLIGLPENATDDQITNKVTQMNAKANYADGALLNEGKEKGFKEDTLKTSIEQNFDGTLQLVNDLEAPQPPAATPSNDSTQQNEGENGKQQPSGTRPSDILQELKEGLQNNGGGNAPNQKTKLEDYTEAERLELLNSDPEKYEKLFNNEVKGQVQNAL